LRILEHLLCGQFLADFYGKKNKKRMTFNLDYNHNDLKPIIHTD
jgi:hypothetical protein